MEMRVLRVVFGMLACVLYAPVFSTPTVGSADKSSLETEVISQILALETTRNLAQQSETFQKLEGLGESAVPYIVKHMDSRKKLKFSVISLNNKAINSFEASRHYSPVLVVDALSAILNQITGEQFGYIYNGGTDAERDRVVKGWRQWCKEKFSKSVDDCSPKE